jgi:alanine dehydrogenase
MRVGIPKEIKKHERRVALRPAGVRELVERGHKVPTDGSRCSHR